VRRALSGDCTGRHHRGRRIGWYFVHAPAAIPNPTAGEVADVLARSIRDRTQPPSIRPRPTKAKDAA